MMAEAPSSLGSEYNPTIAAKYYELASGLELSTRHAEAAGKLNRELASASYQYGRGNLLRSEPKRIKANANAANSQGLAESGQLAKAQSDTQSEYAQKQLGLSQQRSEAVKRAVAGENEAREKQLVGKGAALETARAEQGQYNIEHPSPAPNPGGVVSSVTSTPNTYAKVGPGTGAVLPTVTGGKPQPVTGGLRKAAVKKLKSGWGY